MDKVSGGLEIKGLTRARVEWRCVLEVGVRVEGAGEKEEGKEEGEEKEKGKGKAKM